MSKESDRVWDECLRWIEGEGGLAVWMKKRLCSWMQEAVPVDGKKVTRCEGVGCSECPLDYMCRSSESKEFSKELRRRLGSYPKPLTLEMLRAMKIGDKLVMNDTENVRERCPFNPYDEVDIEEIDHNDDLCPVRVSRGERLRWVHLDDVRLPTQKPKKKPKVGDRVRLLDTRHVRSLHLEPGDEGVVTILMADGTYTYTVKFEDKGLWCFTADDLELHQEAKNVASPLEIGDQVVLGDTDWVRQFFPDKEIHPGARGMVDQLDPPDGYPYHVKILSNGAWFRYSDLIVMKRLRVGTKIRYMGKIRHGETATIEEIDIGRRAPYHIRFDGSRTLRWCFHKNLEPL